MIKSKNEMFLISIIGFLSSAVSYIFTILMLMSFAETRTEKALYFFCGVIIDGVKWFSLITLIKYYRARLFKNFYLYGILFLLFFSMSITASVSYSIYTVKKQMYNIELAENPAYTNILDQLNKSKTDLTVLETEKANELSRLNSELDGLPLDYITRRKELSDKKLELTTFYDNKVATLKTEIETKANDLSKINNKPQEIKTLKPSSIATFFETISNVARVNVDNIIVGFAIALGVILDLASIALTFDKSFSYQNRRSFKSDITNFKNIRLLNSSLKNIDKDSTEDTEGKIFNYNDFVSFIKKNDLNINKLNYSDVEALLPKSSFYKYKNDYMEMEFNA